jgi:hypothetical protein
MVSAVLPQPAQRAKVLIRYNTGNRGRSSVSNEVKPSLSRQPSLPAMAGQLERGWSVVRRAAPVLGLALLVLIWEMVSLATAAASPSPRYNLAARCSATVLQQGPQRPGRWLERAELARALRASAWRRWSVFRSAS